LNENILVSSLLIPTPAFYIKTPLITAISVTDYIEWAFAVVTFEINRLCKLSIFDLIIRIDLTLKFTRQISNKTIELAVI
jgi:hypothetical protein